MALKTRRHSNDNEGKVALVTGASRGIGRAVALELARKGFDLVLAARTVNKGEKHKHGIEDKATILPGSLEETAELVEAEGVKAICVRMDILNQAETLKSLDEVLHTFGKIDVFVNNAIYKGRGNEQLFLDLEDGDYKDMIQCNVLTPVAIIRKLLPKMLDNDSGVIFHLSSSSINMKPRFSVKEGGWDYAYTSTKAAIAKLLPMLAVEHRNSNVRFYNIEPGLVVTALMKERGQDFATGFGDVPPEITGAVVAWLSSKAPSDPVTGKFNGKTIYAPKFCEDLQIIPGYQEKKPDAKVSKL